MPPHRKEWSTPDSLFKSQGVWKTVPAIGSEGWGMKPRSVYGSARQRGTIKPQPCEVCGNPKTDGHHTDYADPLKVKWLCRSHHRAEHWRLKHLGIEIPNRHLLAQTTVIPVTVSKCMASRLRSQAKREFRSVPSIIRMAIDQLLKEESNA